jgi:hypothetical protein
MATVRLSDVIIPEVYADYTTVNTLEKTALWESGVVVRDSSMDAKASSGGRILDMPFWRDIDPTVEPNISTDNPATSAVPNKITAGHQVARNAYLNQGYSASDLAGEIAGSNPMQRVRDRFGVYWQRQWQRRLISSARGILADNIANDASDMVETAGAVFSRTAFVAALFTLGDLASEITTIVVHSAVMQQMVDQEDIEFITPSDGSAPIATFLGRRVIMDDNMPATATTVALGTIVFTSMLFGRAAFGYGEGTPNVPVELEREAAQGNGAGVETLWERKTWLLHPFGFEFTSAAVASESATNAELATVTNWNRVIPRKNVPLAFLQTTLTVPTP